MTTLKLLVADDQPKVLNHIKKALESRNIEIVTAPNGQKAFEFATRERFDLFLVDLTMPTMSGFDFLRKVKSIDKLHQIPVVILTGDKRDHSVLNCLKHGAADYIVKPFDIENLYSRILQITKFNAQKHEGDSQSESGPKRQKKILIIDSDHRDAVEVETLLENSGIPQSHIRLVERCDQVEEIINSFQPDTILLDPYLPTIEDGLVLIGMIQKWIPDKKTPIIIMSQFQIPLRYLNIFQINQTDYLLKPFSKEILVGFLNRATRMPGFENQRIGNDLIKEGLINVEQLNHALMIQNQMSIHRLSIGALAMVKEYMTMEEVINLYPLFEMNDQQFIEMALATDMLTKKQAAELVDLKKRFSFRLGDLLVQLGFVRKALLESVTEKKKHHFDVILDRKGVSTVAGQALFEKIKKGQAEALQQFIHEGANVNMRGAKGLTPLMMAASTGKVPLVFPLLEAGADLDATNEDRWTPLHFAIFNKHSEVVTLLLARGARVDINDRWGRSAEDLAVECGGKDLVWLIKNMAKNLPKQE